MKVGKKNPFAFSAPLYCYKIIVLHITFHLPPKIFHVSTNFFSIRVCSVGGKIERERERERERSVWLEGGGGGNFGGAQKFSPRLIKTKSPQIEEKMGEKIVQKCPRQSPLCTCCCPLFPILFFKKKKILIHCVHAATLCFLFLKKKKKNKTKQKKI